MPLGVEQPPERLELPDAGHSAHWVHSEPLAEHQVLLGWVGAAH